MQSRLIAPSIIVSLWLALAPALGGLTVPQSSAAIPSRATDTIAIRPASKTVAPGQTFTLWTSRSRARSQ
jgi:hypothetical protein